MSTFEEQIAAATLAKIFGSELKRVDESTLQQTSSGPATRLDPASFLTATHEVKQRQKQQQVDYSNQLAEQLHPLPPPIQSLPVPEYVPPLTTGNNVLLKTNNDELISTLKSIDETLIKLVNIIETKWQSVY